MSWLDQLTGDSLAWLLEEDMPAVRYQALRDLLDRPDGDEEMTAAQAAAHRQGPITAILEAMDEPGYWAKPGPGYLPKYRSTVWSVIMLAQLGASAALEPRIQRACAYLLDQALTTNGQFTSSGAPSGSVDCLQGNLCAALLDLGYDDPRLANAFDWMARTVTGEGIAPKEERHAPIRYYAGKCGPLFACGANNNLSCAWGGVKVMLAFGKWPAERRTPTVRRAIEAGAEFLLAGDPAQAGYPNGWNEKPSGNWWKFGFPVFYVTDLLQNVEALVSLGYGRDPRLAGALEIVRQKQDEDGRWVLEYDYRGKTWVDVGAKKQPNKWVTLRAMRVLKAAA